MNVAASRARNQLWAFYSMDVSALNANDLRRGLIEYVRDYAVDDTDANPMEVARTDFERDVLGDLATHGYRDDVHAQYRVGRYAIDCVVDLGRGLRLAIECDGDERKSADEFSDDIVKQRVLERLGWHFVRVAAAEYYLNRESAMAPVYDHLDGLSRMRLEASGLTMVEHGMLNPYVALAAQWGGGTVGLAGPDVGVKEAGTAGCRGTRFVT